MKKTNVAFKIEVNPHTKEREVFAFFPDEKDEHEKGMFTSYSHVGQHSLCAKSYFNKRQWANFHEYLELYLELVRIGYKNLNVLNKDWEMMKSFAIQDDFGHRVNSVEARIS